MRIIRRFFYAYAKRQMGEEGVIYDLCMLLLSLNNYVYKAANTYQVIYLIKAHRDSGSFFFFLSYTRAKCAGGYYSIMVTRAFA